LADWARERVAADFRGLRVPVDVSQASSEGHSQIEAARGSIPMLDEVVMPGVGHFMMLGRPPLFNGLLESLLNYFCQNGSQRAGW
jgi:pimeloyl-ACP methyl ester carboxylesterase